MHLTCHICTSCAASKSSLITTYSTLNALEVHIYLFLTLLFTHLIGLHMVLTALIKKFIRTSSWARKWAPINQDDELSILSVLNKR